MKSRPWIVFLACGLLLGTTPLLGATLLGLHDVKDPTQALELKPKAVRQLIYMNYYTLWHELVTNGNAEKIRKQKGSFPLLDLATYKKNGVKVIATTFLWNKKRGVPDSVPVPRPGSQEWNEAMTNMAHFVANYGQYVDWLVLDNEPQLEYSDEDWKDRGEDPNLAIQFLNGLAQVVDREKYKDAGLRHIRVMAPGVFNLAWFEGGMPDLADGPKAHLEQRVKRMFRWGQNSKLIQGLDVHVHLESAQSMAKTLLFLKKEWDKEVVMSEWDQAMVGTRWLNAPLDPPYAEKYGLSKTMAKRKYIEACYTKRIPLEQWNEFMATAPFEKSFLWDTYRMADDAGIKAICYSFPQYGSSQFDTCQLTAGRTVPLRADGKPEWNGRFHAWYVELMRDVEGLKF